MSRVFYLTLTLVSVLTGCADKHSALTGLDSIAWMQTSEEYRALSLGAYHLAGESLDKALQDGSWTALPSQVPANSTQASALGSLPPAVILDIDETLLSTLPYQAWLIKNNRPFTRASWNAWVSEASAEAMPGALEFVHYAMGRGVTVFYMSNRSAQGAFDSNANGQIEPGEEQVDLKPFTITNLVRLGFLPQKNVSNDDSVLLRNETGRDGQTKSGWASSDKTARRESLSRNYRIVLIMGDNLNDFVGEATPDSYQSRWGRSWIMLPNPVYGYWENRLYDSRHTLTDEEKIEIKLNRLDTWQ